MHLGAVGMVLSSRGDASAWASPAHTANGAQARLVRRPMVGQLRRKALQVKLVRMGPCQDAPCPVKHHGVGH
jgi:hypothetical protein